MFIRNLFAKLKNILLNKDKESKKIRVLQIIASSIGGGAAHLNYILKYIDRDKYFVDTVIPSDGGRIIDLDKNKCKTINIEKGIRLMELFKLNKLIRKNRPDLIHLHGFRAGFNLWFLSLFKLINVKCVYTIHGFHAIRYDSFIRRFYQKWINRKIINMSSKVILVSEQDKIDGIKHKMFKDISKIVLIKNGIDLDKYDIKINNYSRKRELGINDDEKVIGCFSRLHKVKRQEFLLRAMPIVHSSIKVRLLMIGQGPEEDNLRKLSKRYSIDKNILFLGECSDVPELLQMVDMVVLLSSWEATPISLLEAMAAGVPILASDVSTIKELITHRETGLLVNPKNHNQIAQNIIELLENNNLRLKLIKNAKEEVKKYNAYDMVKKIEKVYEEVLNK